MTPILHNWGHCKFLTPAPLIEHASKRATERLGPVRPELLRPGFWAEWDRRCLERSSGNFDQYKHPCLISDPQFHETARAALALASFLGLENLFRRRAAAVKDRRRPGLLSFRLLAVAALAHCRQPGFLLDPIGTLD